jgi:hypothetical protein
MTNNYSKERSFAKNKPLILMLYVLFLFGCDSYSKEEYLKDFSDFANNVEINSMNYNEEDWKLKDADFQNYTTELHNQFKEKLTENDQILIGKLKTKYLFAKSKSEIKNLGEQIKDGINQIKGAIDEVFEEDNVDQIKAAKEEILEENNRANK